MDEFGCADVWVGEASLIMHEGFLEEIRSGLEALEVMELAIVEEIKFGEEQPKERAVAEHRVVNLLQMIQAKAEVLRRLQREDAAPRKEELAFIEGSVGLKGNPVKKTGDSVWQNYYEKVRDIREKLKEHKGTAHDAGSSREEPTHKGEGASSSSKAKFTVDYARSCASSAPFKEPYFSVEEAKGKYLDLHTVYLDYVNVARELNEGREEQTRLHDYLWYLQNFDQFDLYPLARKVRCLPKYKAYLVRLGSYLESFYRRSRPLQDVEGLKKRFEADFEAKFANGRVPGWDQHSTALSFDRAEYCDSCEKIFLTNEAFVNHQIGKKHLKARERKAKDSEEGNSVGGGSAEERARAELKAKVEERNKELARLEHAVAQWRQELGTAVWESLNLVRKKQTRGLEEEEEVEVEEESGEEDAPIYNPKNLPLGWDGKPIPYWLYKLHGLGIEFKCEICGNYSYWGRRAFEMHFQEWRHTYGMRCLKIPNTVHFKDITSIKDALMLHRKLTSEAQDTLFRPELHEEFEDSEGNLLNKKTFLDMRKQGLL